MGAVRLVFKKFESRIKAKKKFFSNSSYEVTVKLQLLFHINI